MKKIQIVSSLWLLVAGLLAVNTAQAVPPPPGIAPVAPPPGGFDIDGNLFANTPHANVGDWLVNTNLASGSGDGVLTLAGLPINTNRTFHFRDPYNGNDNVFVGGLKWKDNPNTWNWTTNKASSKTDLQNVLIHLTSDTNGHTWAILAADRFSTSGDSYIDFEFLQNLVTANADRSFSSAGTNGGRTVGDFVLSLAFVGGGSTADFFFFRWQTNGSGGFDYVDTTTALPAGRVFVALNTNNTLVPYGAFGQTNYAPNAFVEAAVDLTALLGTFDPCSSFGFKTIMVKTKASASDTATIEDFITPFQYTLRIGPDAQAGPDQVRCSESTETAFPLNGSAGSGLAAVASTTWSVVSGSATIDAPTSLVTTARLSSASATLRLTVVQANGCVETDDIVLSVQPPPVCSISGVTNACPRTTNTFSAPVGMNSYSWLVTGGGFISGPANQQTVKVVASALCGTNYTLALTSSSNVCAVSCGLDVAVVDSGAPVLTCPADRILDCPAITTTNVTGVATATDSCSRATVTYSDDVTNLCGATKIIARTWTATDECGNSVSCVQTITVRDLTPPVITCPPNRTPECPADLSTGANGVATATDACSSATITFNDVITTNCGNTLLIARTWTATDACNNRSSCVQTITVRDTTAPVIACPANMTLDFPADTSTANTGVATGTDTCGTVTIGHADTITTNCGNTYLISRLWTAADECGNRSTCTQTIRVRDITAPLITCPPNVTLECPAITTTNVTGVATATDESGPATIAFTDSVTNLCGNTKVIARRWTASDLCGNQSSCTQTITVVDTTPPVITCAAAKTVECTAPWTFDTPSASDTCGTNSIAIVSTTTNAGCGHTFSATRTWRATDACGNLSACSQTVTVVDTTAPIITCAPNKDVECTAPWTFDVPTATDTCGSTTVRLLWAETNRVGFCGQNFIATSRWEATDACGNQVQCSQSVYVHDRTPPVITCASNKTVPCGSAWTFDPPTAYDTCGTNSLVILSTVTNVTCGNTFIATRTWRAKDGCDNFADCSQVVTVVDTTPPVITCVGNKAVQCGTAWTFDTPTADDGCGTNTITIVSTTTNASCGGTFTATRLWRATDACGNQSQCSQTVTVVDTTAPVIACLPNKTIQCGTTWTFDVPTATDTCGTNSIAIINTVTNVGCGNTFTAMRTWRATDACGNQSQCSQTVTVIDTTAPVITCPANLTLECPAVTTTNATGMATATDVCGTPTIAFSDSVSNTCGNAKVILRTWRATDACGNSSTCVQTITVRDLTPPTLVLPANLAVECGASTATNATGTATASDACNTFTLTYSDTVSNTCGLTRVISRRWLASDSCGNSNSAVQTITVRDTTPPALTLPANRVLDCPGDTRTNVTGVATAVDGCGSVTISYSDVVTNGCGMTRTVQRLWTATDQCGNSTNGLQIIAVRNVAPTIACRSLSVQCVGDVPAAYASLTAFRLAGGTATSSCDTSLDFALMSDSGLIGRCPGHVTRVYRVTDDCGAVAECTQTITVDDTIAPAITCPASVTVECGASLDPASLGSATATDNCSTNVPITHTDSMVDSSYNLKWYSSDPDSGTGPYAPTYLKFAPGSLPCPGGGRAIDPLRNAVAFAPNGQLDALTSLGNVPLALGQIVPFQLVIEASGGPGTDRGTIEFTSGWSTYTTSNERFGYDTNYMVYCAFVDPADPGSIDPNFNARVESFSSTVINRGTIGERIQGTFRVSGIDSGDRIIVEVWVVLMSTMPDHVGGTIAADLVSARKLSTPPQDISIGAQTVSIGNLSKMTTLPPPQAQPPAPPIPPQPTVPPGATVSVIDRTWAATDDCGNRSTCVQRITVRDTTPPVLTAPADLVLNCPADTSTNNTGVAIAQDGCGSVVVTYSDSVSNSCGGAKTIWRTWTAIDQSGNTNRAVQILIVRDTTPPTLTVGENRTINAGDAFSFDLPVATDTCGSASFSVLGTVTNNLLTPVYDVTRTWSATDACGNATTNHQTISVVAALPRVTLVSAQSQQMTLRWPAYATDYRLEFSVDLKKWSPMGIVPVVSNGWCIVQTPMTGPQKFFRLVNTPPALESVRTSPGRMTLTWPTAPSGFVLESTDNLLPPNWMPVVATPTVSNMLNRVDINLTAPKQFYRLKK